MLGTFWVGGDAKEIVVRFQEDSEFAMLLDFGAIPFELVCNLVDWDSRVIKQGHDNGGDNLIGEGAQVYGNEVVRGVGGRRNDKRRTRGSGYSRVQWLRAQDSY